MISLRVDPHKGIEPHSLETSLSLGTVELDISRIRVLFAKLKEKSAGKMQDCDAGGPPLPLSGSPLTSRSRWASPLSANSPFREALSVSAPFSVKSLR